MQQPVVRVGEWLVTPSINQISRNGRQLTHTLLVAPQGISVPTNVSHQRSYYFNRISLRRTVPSQSIATYLKGVLRSELGSIVTPIQIPQR